MGRWGGQAVTYAVALKGSEHRQELPARVEVVDFGNVELFDGVARIHIVDVPGEAAAIGWAHGSACTPVPSGIVCRSAIRPSSTPPTHPTAKPAC